MKKFLSIFVLSLMLSGCSVFESSPRRELQGGAGNVESKEGSPVSIKEFQRSKDSEDKKESDIQVTWEAPDGEYDGFILRYGSKAHALTQSKKIEVSELNRIDDPVKGILFEYILRNISQEGSMFLTVSAFRGDEIFPASEVTEIN